jgi:hypothetical protein
MASNCAETASNGLDPAIADVVVVVKEIPRCSAIAPSASAATRLSRFPPYRGRVHPLPASNCDTPAARRPSRQCDSIRTQQQQQRSIDDDQIFVSGAAHKGGSAPTNDPIGAVTPAYASADPQTTDPSQGDWIVVPTCRRRQRRDPTRVRGSSTPLPNAGRPDSPDQCPDRPLGEAHQQTSHPLLHTEGLVTPATASGHRRSEWAHHGDEPALSNPAPSNPCHQLLTSPLLHTNGLVTPTAPAGTRSAQRPASRLTEATR